jgi:hypothetical protein
MSETDQDYVEGLGLPVFPAGVNPLDYPPHTMSPSEEAATVGRFVINQEVEAPPEFDEGDGEYKTGGTVAAPQGVFYSRDETKAKGKGKRAKGGERVSPHEASVAAQSEAVRSATPDMVEQLGDEEVDHLSDAEKGAKSGPFEDRKAPEVGFGALDEGTVEKLDEKEEEMVLARQGQKTPDEQVLAEPAKPADAESVDAAFEVTAQAEAQSTDLDAADVGQDAPDIEGNLRRTPEEQEAANAAAEPDEPDSVLEQKTKAAAGESTDEEVEPEDDEDTWDNYTVAELKSELDNRGLEYDSGARKADLVKLLEDDDEAG